MHCRDATLNSSPLSFIYFFSVYTLCMIPFRPLKQCCATCKLHYFITYTFAKFIYTCTHAYLFSLLYRPASVGFFQYSLGLSLKLGHICHRSFHQYECQVRQEVQVRAFTEARIVFSFYRPFHQSSSESNKIVLTISVVLYAKLPLFSLNFILAILSQIRLPLLLYPI